MEIASKLACPQCAYALDGLQTTTCPECGYEPEPNETENESRRRLFIELTRLSQHWWIAAFGALLVYLMLNARDPLTSLARFGERFETEAPIILLWFVAPIFLAVGLLAQTSMAANCPAAYRPLVRRVWRMSMIWMQVPWLLACTTLFVVKAFYSNALMWGAGSQHSETLSNDETIVVVLASGGLGTLISPFLWHWRWKHLIRLSGLPSRTIEQVGAKSSACISLIPGALVFILPDIFLLAVAAFIQM
jgi:hypothetical protein